MTGIALVLVAHGSHLSPDTGGLVWDYVDQLRRWNVADEITAAFWKEQPAYSQVLDTLTSDTVTIVPVFAAEGYFSTQVVPAEMGLEAGLNRIGSRSVYYSPAISEHPRLTDIVIRRVQTTLHRYQLDPAQTAVAIIGHGTRRSRDSQSAAIRQADSLRNTSLVAEVIHAFLDDDPDIPSIFERITAKQIIALPLFLAPGSHVSADIPAALGLPEGSMAGFVHHRRVILTEPVGSSVEELATMILEQAQSYDERYKKRPTMSAWSGFPRVGAEALIQAVQQESTLELGQLTLTTQQVQRTDDDEVSHPIHAPGELRAIVRENPFRPLATSDDLPGGWYVPLSDVAMLPAVLETVYPGALADWDLHRQGVFQAETLATVGQRQLGMFRDIDTLPGVEQHVKNICGRCVRHTTWFYGESPSAALPCKSPCNVWLSQVAEAAA